MDETSQPPTEEWAWERPQMEDFLFEDSKAFQVKKVLDEMGSTSKGDGGEQAGPKEDARMLINESKEWPTFIITERPECLKYITGRSKEDLVAPAKEEVVLDKFPFMQQLETDEAEWDKVRSRREDVALNFKTLGNEAYRKFNFERAILMYTKAIELVLDSPVLYNSRAICYIKVRNYKAAIIDCDYVINDLDEKNLNSWLYRAAAFKRMGEEKNFETSIKLARKNNPKLEEQIASFVFRMNQL